MKARLFFLALTTALFTPVVPAEEPAKFLAKFRLKKDPMARTHGWVTDFDGDGFTFERFGGARRTFVRWSDLVDTDAKKLRQQLKLELTEEEKLGLIRGQRLHFVGGVTMEGVLEAVDADGTHWLRSDGLLMSFRKDRIAKVEPIEVREREVFDEQDLYYRKLERTQPTTAAGHRELADYSFEIGNFAKAREHYRAAITRRPALQSSLTGRLSEIKELLRDESQAHSLALIRRRSRLFRDYDGALELLRKFADDNPDSKRAAVRLEDELKEQRLGWLRDKFHVQKHVAARRVIQKYLRTKRPGIDQAMKWIRTDYRDQIMAYVRQRMRISEEEYAEFAKSKSKVAPHFAGYADGSFVISPRAKRGKSSKKKIRGDPDSWWEAYAHNPGQLAFLRAFAAENVPELFEVIEIRVRPCKKCGGTGQVKHMSIHSLESTGHEWRQNCPRCYGARDDRIIVYK